MLLAVKMNSKMKKNHKFEKERLMKTRVNLITEQNFYKTNND